MPKGKGDITTTVSQRRVFGPQGVVAPCGFSFIVIRPSESIATTVFSGLSTACDNMC